jgi:dTDP-glucose 4,6-dehydratase
VRLLVTGGAGFIGSHFVRTALLEGYPGVEPTELVVLDKLTYAGRLENLEPVKDDKRFRFVQGDIVDPAALADLVPGTDLIVNFAAESHVDRSITGAAEFVRTNAVGVQTLLDAAQQAGVRRFVQVSTDEVYGSRAEGDFVETDALNPSSPYSASKAAGDLLARAYVVTHDMDVVITRCTNNYGPYQFPEKVIPLFVTNLFDGRPVPLYGEGLNVRDWLHVDDHCRAIALVLTGGRSGEIYNISGGIAMTNRELTERLVSACGRDWSFVQNVTDRLGHDFRYAIDDAKIRDELGYAPRHSFENGLAETVKWFRDNEWWWRPLKQASAR